MRAIRKIYMAFVLTILLGIGSFKLLAGLLLMLVIGVGIIQDAHKNPVEVLIAGAFFVWGFSLFVHGIGPFFGAFSPREPAGLNARKSLRRAGMLGRR